MMERAIVDLRRWLARLALRFLVWISVDGTTEHDMVTTSSTIWMGDQMTRGSPRGRFHIDPEDHWREAWPKFAAFLMHDRAERARVKRQLDSRKEA